MKETPVVTPSDNLLAEPDIISDETSSLADLASVEQSEEFNKLQQPPKIVIRNYSVWEEHDDEPSELIKKNDPLILAVLAAKDAKHARNLFISSTSVYAIGWLFFPVLLAGLILMILGFVYLSKSSRSRYITERGEQQLRSAKAWMAASLVLVGLFLALVGAILIIFVL